MSSVKPLSRKSPYLENYGALICGKPLSQIRALQSVFGPYLGNPPGEYGVKQFTEVFVMF